MSEKVTLLVNGKVYDGWKEVEIKNTLKAVAGSFSLSITDRWTGQNVPWSLTPGDSCVAKLGDDIVISGFIDTVSPTASKDSRAIAVSGRDKTCDLVDCSVDHPKGEFQGVTLDALAKILCQPFGISVKFNGSVGAAFEMVKINQGDTVFEVLEKKARNRGFLITTDGKGTLIFTRPSSVLSSTRLEFGKNLVSGSATFDGKHRYSKYVVKGQDSTISDPKFAYALRAVATDPTVKRYRPLIIQNEQLTGPGDAQTRANWEATVRAARASTFQLVVKGWRQGDGTLWRPNQLVQCKAEWIGLNGELLITDVSYRLSDNNGETVTLGLERKDAYIPQPEVPEKGDPLIQAIKKDPGFKRTPL